MTELPEREKCMLPTRYGYRNVPGKGSSGAGGIVAVGFGIFWIITASSITGFGGSGPFAFMPQFGLLFIVVGAGTSAVRFAKAAEHEKALQRYHRRRADSEYRTEHSDTSA